MYNTNLQNQNAEKAIKITTLFGLLAMEIAIAPAFREYAKIAGFVFLVIALVFVIRSFYAMRIPQEEEK